MVAADPSSSSSSARVWWDAFVPLFKELDASPRSSDIPEALVTKIRLWFQSSFSGFKPRNEASRKALESPVIMIGSQRLAVVPGLRDIALRVSSYLIEHVTRETNSLAESLAKDARIWYYNLQQWYHSRRD